MKTILGEASPGLLGVAACTWAAAAAARWWGGPAAAAIVAGGALLAVTVSGEGRLRSGIVVLVVAASGAGASLAAADRQADILSHATEAGDVDVAVRLVGDPRRGDHGWWALAVPDPPEGSRPGGVPMLLAFSHRPGPVAGERLRVHGHRSGRVGTARGDAFSGVVRVEEAHPLPSRHGWWWSAGNALRARVLTSLASGSSAAHGLLAGFLVGDTSGVPEADLEAMRRSGLSHLVAVSGSNVALFLSMTLVAAGPMASGPRRRAVVGLAALAVFVVATRWEPSVLRASAMAALMMTGRVAGWALDPLGAVAVAVIGSIVVAADLATDVGFALSALATVGVVAGSRAMPASVPPLVARPIGATIGAQVAVAPLLLAVFGPVPLLAPVANLVAVPVVAATTAVATVGVALGWGPVVDAAAVGASVVLAVARIGAGWPQLGWAGAGAIAALGVLATAIRSLRPIAAAAGALVVALGVLGVGTGVERPAAVVLDVGQGDAVLLLGSDDTAVLVDGGPEAGLLEAKLSAYGVRHLDLVILTHVHADHATGLSAVFGRRRVDTFWAPDDTHRTPRSRQVMYAARRAGLSPQPAPVGETISVGEFSVEVLGPVRRYDSPNDQSIVVRVGVGDGPRLLLSGDIETHAQADLRGVAADVLKVPHQGAATSDLDWLAGVGARRAVISVGPNDFGHPAPEVVEALQASGAVVRRTDLHGDVVVPLGTGGR